MSGVCKCFFRYLHVAAEKTYRSLGGHQDLQTQSQRCALTAQGIKKLAREFPRLVTFDGHKKTTNRGQSYRLHHVGSQPIKMSRHIQNRGRPLTHFRHRSSLSVAFAAIISRIISKCLRFNGSYYGTVLKQVELYIES